jgi:hypothetical protein
MEDIIAVTNLFIRGVKPSVMNNHLEMIIGVMEYFDKPSVMNNHLEMIIGVMEYFNKLPDEQDILTIESIPQIFNRMFGDRKINWGRILTIIWVGVYLKDKYPDQTDHIYNIIVIEWFMDQRPLCRKVIDYIKSFIWAEDDVSKFFIKK